MAVITVVAKLVVKEGAVETVKSELLKMIEPTRGEKGCLEYRLHQDNDNPAVFVFYENWLDSECLVSHTKSAHYKQYVSAVDGLIAEKTVNKLTCIA